MSFGTRLLCKGEPNFAYPELFGQVEVLGPNRNSMPCGGIRFAGSAVIMVGIIVEGMTRRADRRGHPERSWRRWIPQVVERECGASIWL